MLKKYLYTPGPTQIPTDINLSMADELIHHRSPEFKEIFSKVREGLKALFKTKEEVLVLTSSGTGAMESAISNLFNKGDKVLVLISGKFGLRWLEIAKAYGLEVVQIEVDWGKPVSIEAVKKHYTDDMKAILLQASETSSGVKQPVKEVANFLKDKNSIIVVDAISGLGVMELPMDEWNIDVLITGSQKTLMLPPGLAFIALNQKAQKLLDTCTLPKYYFDLKKQMKAQLKDQTAYTPAISIIVGLLNVLKKIKEEGLENIIKRHDLIAKATRESVRALGLVVLNSESPVSSCTAVIMPERIDGSEVVKAFRKEGLTIAGGQDHLKGKIIRLGHLGYITKTDVLIMISILEIVLKKMGVDIELGKGVKKAQQILFFEE